MSIKSQIKNAIVNLDIIYQKRWLEKYEVKKIEQ